MHLLVSRAETPSDCRPNTDSASEPWQINALDPAVLFSTVYTSLLYGIFYSFFESTPLVFPKIYHFNLGTSGLPYLSALVAILIIGPIYASYWYFFVERPFAIKGFGPQEERLKVGLVGSCMIPAGLFLYGMFFPIHPTSHFY